MYNTVSELSNDLLQTYFNEYYELSDPKKIKMSSKNDSFNLALGKYEYSEWYKELDDLPPLKYDEEKYYKVPSMPLSKSGKDGIRLKI